MYVWIILQKCENHLHVYPGYETYWSDIWKMHVTHTVSSWRKNSCIPTIPKRRNLWRPFDLPRWYDRLQPLLISKQDSLSLLCCFCINWTLNLIYRKYWASRCFQGEDQANGSLFSLYTWGGTEWRHESQYSPKASPRV